MNSIATVTLFESGQEVAWIYDLVGQWKKQGMDGVPPWHLCRNGKYNILSVRPASGDEQRLHPQLVRIIYRPLGSYLLTTMELSGYWFYKEPGGRNVVIFQRDDIVQIRHLSSPAEKSRDYSGEQSLLDIYGPSTFRVANVGLVITSAPRYAHPQWVTLNRHDCVGLWRNLCPQGVPRISGFFLEKHSI